ncbi:MAG: hypothetical protein WA160_06925 [Pseudobdellovibrio sp.]
MLPKLVETLNLNALDFWFTSNRVVGISFKTRPLDLEVQDMQHIEQNLESIIKALSEKVKMRIHFFSDMIQHRLTDHSRVDHLKEIGETNNNIIIHFEMKFSVSLFNKNIDPKAQLNAQALKLYDLLPLDQLNNSGFQIENIRTHDLKSIFWDVEQPIMQKGSYLDSGFDRIGVIKLIKPSSNSLTLLTLTNLKNRLPQSYEIQVALKKVSTEITRNKFANAAKRESSSTNISGQTKSAYADEAAAGIELRGENYFAFEWHLILRRNSEEELKIDLKKAYNELRQFSEFKIETIGAFPSFLSTLVGSDFHFSGLFESLTEKDETLICYLPFLTFGVGSRGKVSKNALGFHRTDFSVDFLDNFRPEYPNSNLNIIGKSGNGKSVFINRKIFADATDLKTSLIIVDVKGSHTRIVEYLNGEVHNINLKESSGINPISFLRTNSDDKTIEVVKTFLCELCLDDDEKKLKEADSIDLGDYLVNYLLQPEIIFTIDDFIKYIPETFERKKFLKRFSSKGLFKHVFSIVDGSNKSQKTNRIRYYNFQSIDTASNTAVTRAMMAAIMADFSYTLANKLISDRLLFCSDETPFFIRHCFRSFCLISKNVRSLNAALLLTVQVSQDLIVDGDQSLIDSAVTHVYLSGDGKKQDFQKRFSLSDEETDKIFALKGSPGVYSQFIIKDALGFRVGNLILSNKEFWQATTKASDIEILDKIRHEFSDLDEDTVIELVSRRNRSLVQGESNA